MIVFACRILIVAAILVPCTVQAHEIRPAYLQMDEISPGTYDVLWKLPRTGDTVPNINLQFDQDWILEEYGGVRQGEFAVFRYRLKGPPESSLAGSQLEIQNLSKTKIDVLVNLKMLDGHQHNLLMHPTSPSVRIPSTPSKWEVVWTYGELGVEHILLGFDHLLFVLALILLTEGFGKVLKTVTAFTVAHSITLSLATLGYVEVPGRPVEAVIALSIVFLAVELFRSSQGEETLTQRKPWLIAFTFGLLHGLGFAGALSEIGLPQTEIPLALACFNIGVELGQVFFIVVVLSLMKLMTVRNEWPARLRTVPAYAIGAISAYWLIDRVYGFVA